MTSCRIFGVAATLLLNALPAVAQRDAADLDLLHVQGKVYMLHGGDLGNIAVQIGSDGVLLDMDAIHKT